MTHNLNNPPLHADAKLGSWPERLRARCAAEHAIMDKAEIFRQVTLRNALRRTAQLPQIDVHAESSKAVTLAAMREYDEVRRRYQADEQRILVVVWSEYRQRHGADFGSAGPGRLAVYREADRHMTAFLSARGFAHPYLPVTGAVYGSAKRVEGSEPNP